MTIEILDRRDDLLIRRMILAPGEAMPWHRDLCRRFSVVVRGDRLGIEDEASGEIRSFAVCAGQAEWDEPTDRVHRGVNVGQTTYEEVVIFFLTEPGQEPQPSPGED